MGTVVSVATSGTHDFSKTLHPSIRLLAGLGVEGDAHQGVTVKHCSRIARDPTQPNLRQVHLLHAELLDELAEAGFSVAPGDIGENILTRGVSLLTLPRGARLRLGEALIEITGLRNPCAQLDRFQLGLTAATLGRDPAGNLVRKAGIMAIVIEAGIVRPGDEIATQLPAVVEPLQPV